ncbi:MAG: FtsX-like permease family protein, partial [Ruminococcus sp.]|nr:FtsX-like permease family protein [Ruminococcus sp.]
MKKRLVLNNRVPRELLSNKLRYGALFLLIVLSMTVIVGMASSTDSILYTCEQNHIETHLEDGEFSVFVPLTEENLKNINDMGIEVEENFYISYTLEDNSDLRVFKNRESINLVQLLDGRLADSDNEIVIENNYALANGYSIGDSITLGSYTYTITGLGYTSDYNLVKKSISDVGADAEKFGTAFVTADTYNIMLSDSLLSVGEEYCYTYILGDESTSKELKDYLKDIELDTTQVENKYMKEIIDDVEKTKIDLKDGVKELSDGRDEINDAVKQFADGAAELLDATKTLEDGSNELCDGIKELYNGTSELYDNNNELVDGANEVFDSLLEMVSSQLQDNGISITLTQSNYKKELNNLLNNSNNSLSVELRETVSSLKDSLDSYSVFNNGIIDYTNGVTSAYNGSKQLYSAIETLSTGIDTLNSGVGAITNNNSDLNDGASAVFNSLLQQVQATIDGMGIEVTLTIDNYSQVLDGLYQQMAEVSPEIAQQILDTKYQLDSYNTFYTGLITYTNSIVEVKNGSSSLVDGAKQLKDGSNSLTTGLQTLNSNSEVLVSGADEVFNSLLNIANTQLNDNGISVTLTQDNYQSELNRIYSTADSLVQDSINNQVKDILSSLDSFNEFYDGIISYTDGVEEVYNGSKELYEHTSELLDGISELSDASIEIYDGSKDLLDGATSLDEGVTELQESVDDLINEYFDFSYQNLSSFVENENNSRIWDYEDDSNTNKMSAIFAGIVVLIMIAYVISVFIMHNIDNESKIIGALYALGYNKKELLSHFLRLPVMISFVGGILGTVLGFATASFQTESSASYYSYGEVQYIQPLYLIVYGIVIPTVITLLVNIIVINKKLSSTPLQLLRKERKENNVSNVNLKDMKFIHKFQIRQFIREFRGNITLFFGVFISILMMVFSFTIYSSIHNMTLHTTDDIKFQYMYTLKFPDDTPPDNCETAYTEGLYTYFDLLGSDLEVSVQGIQKDSNYFNFDVHDTEKNEVYVSSSASIKFGWTTGDTIVLKNDIDGTNYALNVKGVVQYSNGLYIFMDIDAMRELFNQEDDYFNTLFSNEELDIESGRINNIITYQDIDDVSSIFMNLMQDMIVMILALSVVIFIIVLYLLLRLMIDKASFSISLIKIFGYNNKEIKKLYLDGNFYTILVTLIVGIPISRVIINAIYPSLVANVNAGMDLSWSLDMYII